MNFLGFFRIKNQIFELKIDFSDFSKWAYDVAQSGVSDRRKNRNR